MPLKAKLIIHMCGVGMLDLVREQDSRMSLKRERARKLNLHIKDRKQKIGRFTLWYGDKQMDGSKSDLCVLL